MWIRITPGCGPREMEAFRVPGAKLWITEPFVRIVTRISRRGWRTGKQVMNKRGHAVVEGVISLLVMALAFQAFLALGRAALARNRALAISRFGTALLSSGAVAEETIAAEVNDHLTTFQVDPYLRWQVSHRRF